VCDFLGRVGGWIGGGLSRKREFYKKFGIGFGFWNVIFVFEFVK